MVKNRKFIGTISFTAILMLAGFLFCYQRVWSVTQNIDVGVGVLSTAVCGNNIVEPPEECDTGAARVDCPTSATCSLTCKINNCGSPYHDLISPVISNVSTTPGYTTSSFTWVATDNIAVAYCNLNYDTSLAYTHNALVNFSFSNYWSDLSNLTSSTLYYYSLVCGDGAGNTAMATGTFTTLGGTINTLTIVAEPEKRVPRPGGNLAMQGWVIIYDPLTEKIVKQLPINLDATGRQIFHSVDVPVGNNYWAVIKGNAHLAKKIIGIDITAGMDLTLDFTDGGSFSLLAGDLAGDLRGTTHTGDLVDFLKSISRDDYLDVMDAAAADLRFGNPSTDIANLNGDDTVDIQDISMILSNWQGGRGEGDIMIK